MIDDLEGLKTCKNEGEELIKHSILLISAKIVKLKRKKFINKKDIDETNELYKLIKEYSLRLKKIFKYIDFDKSTDEIDSIEMFTIYEKFTNWTYSFTSEVMDKLETAKDYILKVNESKDN